MGVVNAANALLRRHPAAGRAAHRATLPLRRVSLPVLSGPGAGLRLSVGDSTLLRVLTRIEPEVEDCMLAHLRPGDTVWDVGANIGWFALLAARRVGPMGHVVAFEPLPANAELIAHNALRNGLAVEVVEAAVSDRPGTAPFDAHSSLSGRLASNGALTVATGTLDGWLERFGTPALIKLDIEGAETDALRGARRLLAHERPVIVCECHGTNGEVSEMLRAAGYRLSTIEIPEVAPQEAPWWVHVLGVPSN